MKFEYPYKSYYRRIIFPLLIFLIVVVFLNLLINITFCYRILFSVFIVAVFSMKLFLSNKHYITSILIEGDRIRIEYYKYTIKKIRNLLLKDFNLQLSSTMSGAYTLQTTLVFREKNKKFLVQYQEGGWKKEKMVELVEYMKKVIQESNN